ncbi:MAG: APC family permease [Kiloniellales bacterium]|nr:APC family permease [Kiloniellales bacterium]
MGSDNQAKAHAGGGSPAPQLQRRLSLTMITLYGLGTTIGAGIYVLVGKVAGRADLFAPLAFLVAALLAGLSAFSFGELSARYPKSAGEAVYVREGLGLKSLALLVGLGVIMSGIVSAAAISLGAGGYLIAYLAAPKWLVVTVVILLLGGCAALGVVQSVGTAAFLTLVEIGGLMLIIVAGAGAITDVGERLPDLVPPMELAAWGGILAGAVLAFYAFIGFEDMVNVAEEVKDVRRVLPAAIVLTLVVTTLLYIVVALVAVLALPQEELAASDAPLALVFERTGGSPVLLTGIAVVATVNGALIQIIMASRVLYGLGRDRAIPAVFGLVNARTRTPVLATGVVTLAVLVLAGIAPIETLAEVTSLIVLTIFTLANLSLVRIKRRDPRPAGIRTVPSWVPWCGFVSSAIFLGLALLTVLNG